MDQIVIGCDSREQMPVHDLDGCEISKGLIVRYVGASLSVFDYALMDDLTPTDGKMMQPGWAIERKSIPDFIGSFFAGENVRRERNKIKRARELWDGKLPIIYVLEGDHESLKAYDYSRFPSGRVNARAVHAKISDLRFAGVHVLLCRSRIIAEYEIVSLLKRRWRRIRKSKDKDAQHGCRNTN